MAEKTSTSTLQPGVAIRPVVSLNQAKQLVKTYFGLNVGKVKELNSYDDKNFYVEKSPQMCGDGWEMDGSWVGHSSTTQKFILKVLNSMDSLKTGHIEAQHGIMFYLASKNVKCPIPCKTLEGETFKVVPIPKEEDVENANANPTQTADNGNDEPLHLIRLLTFVEGQILYDVPISAKLLHKTGAYIAQIEILLKQCNNYPVLEAHSTIWMLGCLNKLSEFVYVIQDQPEKFNLVNAVLAEFKNNIEPLIPSLEKGLLHGDYNEQNILVQPSLFGEGDFDISGIIDFGDMHHGPYVFELAITVCYMMLESIRCALIEPFESVEYVVAGYASFRKIPEIELKLLRTLVACRLCQSLVMGAYTRTVDPGNDYILTTAGRGWDLLDKVWNNTSDEQFLGICKKYLN